MALQTQNLGLVRAIHVGTTPPSNIKMIWYNTNTGVNKHYYYDVVLSEWKLLLNDDSSSSSGIKEKLAARVATTGLEGAVTYNAGSKTITYNANGSLVIDDVTLVAGDRVLWGGNTTNLLLNGLYTVTSEGSVSTPAVLTRATDSDISSKVSSGEVVFISEGKNNSNIWFILITANPFVLNTSTLRYVQFSSYYSQSTAITETIGDWNAGDIPNFLPVQQVLYKMLNKYQTPSFSAFSISGQATTLELGQKILGGATNANFLWTSLNNSNFLPNTVKIVDVTNSNTVVGQNLANDGSESLGIPDISKNTSGSQHQYRIEALNSKNQSFNRSLIFTWLFRRCFFISATDYITPSGNDAVISAALNALTVNTQYELNAARAMTKTLNPTSHYIYFVWDTSLGGDENIFTVNGLPNTSWLYKDVTYTNPYGLPRTYRIFRSQNILSTSFNVVVS